MNHNQVYNQNGYQARRRGRCTDEEERRLEEMKTEGGEGRGSGKKKAGLRKEKGKRKK